MASINEYDGERQPLKVQEAASRQVAKAKARRALSAALVFTTVFMVGEIAGGYLANSLAIMTDAAHLLTDIGSMFLSLFAMWLSSQSPTSQMSFGFHRAEILGALASVLTIWALTGILVYEGVQRLLHPPQHVDGKIMFIVASGGLFINIIDAFILHYGAGGMGHGHGHGHAHTHGHSHGAEKKVKNAKKEANHEEGHSHNSSDHDHSHEHEHGHDGKKYKRKPDGDIIEVHPSSEPQEKQHKKKEEKNINVYAAFIHVVGDCVQSLGVMGASALIWWRPEWKIADPIVTFLFSTIVLFTTVRLLRQSLEVLMEGVPQGVDIHAVQTDLEAVKHVGAIHDLHIWSITVGQPALSVHLILLDGTEDASTDDILAESNRVLRDQHGILHTTIQIERTSHRSECDNMAFHLSHNK